MILTSVKKEFITSWKQQLKTLQHLTGCCLTLIVQSAKSVNEVICSTQASHKYFGDNKRLDYARSFINTHSNAEKSYILISKDKEIKYFEQEQGYVSVIISPIFVKAKKYGNLVLLSKKKLSNQDIVYSETFAVTIGHQLELNKKKKKLNNVISGDSVLINRLKHVLKITDTTLNIVDGRGKIIFHSHKNVDEIEESCFSHFRNLHDLCEECPRRKKNVSKSIYTYHSLLNDKTYQVTAVPFTADNGEIFMAEIRVDITDRAKAEKRVEDLKDLLEFSMIAGQIAYLEYDINENTIKTNEYFEKITGYNFKDAKISLQWILSRIYPTDANKIKRIFLSSKNSLNKKLDFDFRLLNAQNKYLWFRYSGKITKIDDRSFPARISGIISDITNLKTALSDLIVQQKRTLKASEAKSIFLANISHEIRTPMNAILGFSDLLSMHINTPPYDSYLASIKSSGNVLLSLINDLLDLEKLNADKMQLRTEMVDFELLIQEIEQSFLMLANQKDLYIKILKPTSFPPLIKLDVIKIKQVLINLINNALKFTKEGGVTIKYKWFNYENNQKGKLVFSVTDSGVGIQKDKQVSIFEPFSQNEDINRKDHAGTGLGLSIVQKLINMMKGTITLKSESGIGSTFSIFIPELECSYKSEKEVDNSNINIFNEVPVVYISDNENTSVLEKYCKRFEIDCVTSKLDYNKLSIDFLRQFKLIIIEIKNENEFKYLNSLKINADPIPVIIITENQKITLPNWLNTVSRILYIPFTEVEFNNTLSKLMPQYVFGQPVGEMENNEQLELTLKEKKDLYTHFDKNIIPVWTGLKEIISSSDLQIFTDELKLLSKKMKWKKLDEYITKIDNGIKSYDFESIQNLLKSFNQLVDEIKQ